MAHCVAHPHSSLHICAEHQLRAEAILRLWGAKILTAQRMSSICRRNQILAPHTALSLRDIGDLAGFDEFVVRFLHEAQAD